ncbi:VirB8/TrbF family protein, partial [Clostridium perfringens]
SWALDREVQAARSRRTAWTVAGVAVAVGLFEAVALAMLAPLKTVEPITLLVDRQTGFVQALNPLAPQRVAADEALTQSYLAQYVTARE